MAPTPLPVAERFFAPEISKVYVVTTLADMANPTRLEIEAGTDVTNEIADISGFIATSGLINTPDYGRRFVSQIGGRLTVDQSTITFYASLDGQDIRTILARGDRVHLIFCDQGDDEGLLADVFAVQVTSVGKVRTTADQAHQITVSFAPTRPPAEDIPLPAVA